MLRCRLWKKISCFISEYVPDERRKGRNKSVSECEPDKSRNGRSQPHLKALQGEKNCCKRNRTVEFSSFENRLHRICIFSFAK